MSTQPKALKPIILMELWQSYAYFGLQAILVFYLIQKLSLPDNEAYAFCGQFVALSYLTPVVGGWIADRFLGFRVSILIGGILLCLGYALLACGQYTLLTGLSLVVIGNGLLLPNLSSFLGEFYTENDSRREAGFTLFYVSANIGALFSVGTAGYLQKFVGWSACFGIASAGLVLGIIVFIRGFHHFQRKGTPILPLKKTVTLLWFCIVFFLIYYSLKVKTFGDYSLYLCGLLFCVYIANSLRSLDKTLRRHMLAVIILFVIALFYKAMFFETYLSVNVFTDRVLDRTLLSHEIPASVFLALGAFFTILVGPLFAKILQSPKMDYSIPVKFSLSLFIIGCAMEMLSLFTTNTNALVPVAAIFLFRLFFSISELFIFPIAYSMVTEYTPKNYVGLMMGGWFLSTAFGGKLAGFLSHTANIPKDITNIHAVKMIYHSAFHQYAILNFYLFGFCLLLTPFINKLLRKNGN